MDEMKLGSWRQRFNEEVVKIQAEFDAFFKSKALKGYYTLTLDESNELSLVISDELPNEIKERLMQVLLTTKPEDSI